MPKKLYKDIPSGFEICRHEDCPQAKACLHQIVCRTLMERDEILRLINPGRCTKDDACPHFRNAAPVAYARGFRGMQQHMFPAQYAVFMATLKKEWGHNPYYERRRGDMALTPGEQQTVMNALRKAGVATDLPFDAYEECFNWYD